MEIQSNEYPCVQCGRGFPASHFVGRRGQTTKNCQSCRTLYKAGNYGIRGSEPRRLLRVFAEEPRVTWAQKSGNKKLGGIPAAIVSPETCPPSCGFYGKGCYAEFGASGHHWRNVEHNGLSWKEFLVRVRELPRGQLWRYAVAGDLPGNGESINADQLAALSLANQGKRGFTMTHKRITPTNQVLIQLANESGFTINLSADTLRQADEKAAAGIAPVVVTVPENSPDRLKTPGGLTVVVCPAQTKGLDCASCQLCANPHRKSVVAFRAHGQMKNTVTKISEGFSVSS
jgi:hypothetical protein